MFKNRRGVVSIITLSLLVILCFSVIIFKGNTSKAGKKEKKTGEELITIEDYEFDGRTTYIGSGFNVAKKGEIRPDELVTNPIFNIDSTKDDSIRNTTIKVDDNSTEYVNRCYQGTTIDKLVKTQAMQISNAYNIDSNSFWYPFGAYGFAHYSTTFKNQTISKRVDEYTKDIRTIKTNNITWTLDEEDYYNYLSESFKKDVMSMEPSKLFDKYGTHFLTSVALGGKLEIASSIRANGQVELAKMVDEFRKFTNFESSSNVKNADIDKEVEKTTDISIDADIDITYKSYGGIGTDFRKFFNNVRKNILNSTNDGKSLTSDSGYKIWVQSVFRKPTLVDVGGSNSLYPIWELVKFFPEYDKNVSKEAAEKRVEELKEAFDAYGQAEYEKAVEKYNKEMAKIEPAKVDTELTGIKYGKHYNKNYKLSDDKAKVHDGYKLGQLIVTNTSKEENGEYLLKGSDFAIEYTVQQDLKKLPVGTSNYKKHYVVSDLNIIKSVSGYGKIFNSAKDFCVGKGAAYIQVIYADQTTEKFSANNVFKGVKQGETTTLLRLDADTISKHKGVDQVKVLTLYETCAYRNPLVQYFYDWTEEATIDFR